MPTGLEQIAQDALALPLPQRFALAERLLESVDAVENLDVDAVWDAEIQTRLRAVKAGDVVGLSYAEVMREAEARLAS